MSLGSTTWRGRHKRLSRRLSRDLRTLLPMIGVILCLASSASVIVAAENVPLHKMPRYLDLQEVAK
jgi:hypothetical protein